MSTLQLFPVFISQFKFLSINIVFHVSDEIAFFQINHFFVHTNSFHFLSRDERKVVTHKKFRKLYLLILYDYIL